MTAIAPRTEIELEQVHRLTMAEYEQMVSTGALPDAVLTPLLLPEQHLSLRELFDQI